MEITAFVKSLKDLDYDQVPGKLLEKVFQKEYTLKSLDVSARTLQSWFDSGLLPYEDLKGKKHWFNFVHLIWLYIVRELRKFGMPLNTIKRAKEQLLEEYSIEEYIMPFNVADAIGILEVFNVYDEYKEAEFKSWFNRFKQGEKVVSLENLFEKEIPRLSDLFSLLVQLMLGSERFFLTISKDGHVEEFSSDQAPELSQFIGLSTKIVLPLNAFFYMYVEDINHLDFLKEIGMVNKMEADLLRIIHKGDYEKAIINFKDKNKPRLELSKEMKKATWYKIINSVARKKYVDIEIKTGDGDMKYVNVTKKIRLK